MEITFQLNTGCIETEAKKIYEKQLRRYFKGTISVPEKRRLEDRIEGIKCFLENADFGYLRSTCRELSRKSGISVTLIMSTDRRTVRIVCKDVVIDLEIGP